MIKVVPIEGKGRGLIATQDIPAWTVILKRPFVEMSVGALDGTPLEKHSWTQDGKTYLVFGEQSLINHPSNESLANCMTYFEGDMDVVETIRAVKAGEELTLDYGTFCDDWDGTF